MNKKTKVLAIGDLHGEKGLAKKLAKKVEKEKIDLIILAGDITFFESSIKGIIGPFAKTKKDILLIPGNHESNATINFLAKTYPNTKNIHGYSFQRGNLGIFGAGGAIYLGPNLIVSEKDIYELLQKGHKKIEKAKKKIMVTHMHHKGSKSEFSGVRGSASVKEAIKKFKPDIVINAHIHEAGGIEEKIGKTKIINVSRKPKVFEI